MVENRVPGARLELILIRVPDGDATVLDRMVYEHPQYTPHSLRAQRQILALGDGRLAFAGAYHGWGFHEDGVPRITMLASARVFGHVFNPPSLFWCHDRAGELRCVVAEVHNTYGERHGYLLETDDAGWASVPKAFYVSPFNDVDGQYRTIPHRRQFSDNDRSDRICRRPACEPCRHRGPGRPCPGLQSSPTPSRSSSRITAPWRGSTTPLYRWK